MKDVYAVEGRPCTHGGWTDVDVVKYGAVGCVGGTIDATPCGGGTAEVSSNSTYMLVYT